MKVYYRLTDIKATNPSPYLQENKFRLNELCLESFVGAFKEVEPEMVFICDYCDSRYRDLINGVVPFKHEIIFTELGINGTCLKQYELAKQDKGIIFFNECDYLWLPSSGQIIVEAIKKLGIVSPYDNRNFYIDRTLHSKTCTLELIEDYHFRSVERNTMTFGLTAEIFKKNYETFYKYGYLDSDVWYDLAGEGQKLWTPIPSVATHCVTDFMAPGVNWNKIYETYL